MTTSTKELAEALADPVVYRQIVLGNRIDDWQQRDFVAMDAGWQTVAGRQLSTVDNSKPFMRAYLERPRGHSKTTDIALSVVWVLMAAKRQVRGVVASGDRDQALLDRNAIEVICRAHPWIADVLEVRADRVVNRHTGSTCEIISSDADTSYGLLVDFIICDELTHWGDSGEALWNSLFSAAPKKQNCLLLIIANAGLGMGSSWQWRVREAARTDADWYFSRLDGPVASWIDPAHLAEQQRFLPTQVFNRLWRNEWTSAAGDMLTREDIEAAVTGSVQPLHSAEDGWAYMAGLDLSTRRDHSALVIVGVKPDEQKVRLASVQSWAPLPGKDIDLEEIELAVLQAAWAFPGLNVGADPWQAEMLMQRCRRQHVNIFPIHFVGRMLDSMATAMLQIFRERLFAMYRDEQLIDQLLRLRIVEKGFGLKIEAPRSSAGGHCDSAMALAIALLLAVETTGAYEEPVADEVIGNLLGL